MNNDDLRQPAPAWLTEQHIDWDKISRLLAEYFEVNDPELFAELMRGELGWRLEQPFDDEGMATVTVFREATGEDTTAGAQCHWSAVVRGGAESS
jgi:hypothetical protein